MPENAVTIGVCAPASNFDKEQFDESVRFIRSLGFNVLFRESVYDRHGYLAGSDETRAQVLNELFADKDVDVIMCARGGYGSSRMIGLLDAVLISANPKRFIGASDACALLFYLENRSECRVYFGPFVTQVNDRMDEEAKALFVNAVKGDIAPYTVTGLSGLVAGKVRGRITGGCLSIIQSSLKTIYEINTDGRILFVEDVAEPLYKIDRMLTHLKNAGKFKNIKGVIVGTFTKADISHKLLSTLFIDIFGEYKIPVVTGFPAGHGENRLLIPFNNEIILDADTGIVKYLPQP